MAKKRIKQKWEIVIKDRFLTNEKPDNLYVTALLYFAVFFLSFLLVFVCFFQLCEVQKTSMLNTLHEGDSVLLLKTSVTYKRGDIVVITKDNNGTSMNIIKRVIAVGGDTLRFTFDDEDGNVQLYLKKKGEEEFSRLNEKYVREPMTKAGFVDLDDSVDFDKDIVIDSGFIFALGDNRNVSQDSRHDGQYPVTSVYGKSVLTVQKDSLLEWLLKLLYHENNTANGLG